MIVKVCGMREPENIRSVEQTGADFMGFIFYPPSPRYVSSRPSYLPVKQKRVGVFVNTGISEILSKVSEYSFDYVQLQGEESPELCQRLKDKGVGVIKAIGISSSDDFKVADDFPMADYMVFDTKTIMRGGSGQSFNWDFLDSYRGKVPFLLSGGISAASFDALTRVSHPMLAGVDINSGFEVSPAVKDAEAIKAFIDKIRSYGL